MPQIRDRIRDYMAKHNLTRFMMAQALRMPVRQLDAYLYDGVTSPYVMTAMMDLLEQHPQVGFWLARDGRVRGPEAARSKRGIHGDFSRVAVRNVLNYNPKEKTR